MSQPQWIQHIATAVDEASIVPLFGNPPEFNLELFTQQLRERLQIGDLELSITGQEWTKGKELLKGMNKSPSVMGISLSPVESHLFWAMSQADLEEFSTWTISQEQEQFHFQDPELQKGYYHFIMLEALLTLRNSGIYPDLSPKLEQASLIEEDCYTIDLSLQHASKSVCGRLIVPKAFVKGFKNHFSGSLPSLHELKVKRKMMLETQLTAGTVSLLADEMRNLSAGDFIVLDHCTYHPETKKGYLLMKMGTHPLAQMKLKEDHIKVLDYAYAIEGKAMENENAPLEEVPLDETAPIQEEQLEEMPAPEGAPVEGETPVQEETAPHPEEPIAQEEPPTTQEAVVEQAPETPMLHPNQVPLTLSVEVAKLNISLEKLVELAPGNVLKTGIYPEQGVKLSLNGRVIGRGELLQMGDALGIKITEIAKDKE